MSTGEGIVWTTIILLLVAGGFLVTKKNKWLLIGKIIGGIALLAVIIGGGVYTYYLYQEYPKPQSELYGVKLGASPVDAKLILGKPVFEGERKNEETSDMNFIQLYKEYSWDDSYKYIRYAKQNGEYHAYLICDDKLINIPFGMGSWTNEEEVVRKLGSPSHESIRADGLAKFLTFGKFNVAIQFQRSKVTSFCVTEDDSITFVEEYQPDSQ